MIKRKLENIKPVKSVSRGYDKEITMDIVSKIYRSFKYPEFSVYPEYQTLYFSDPKVCKIQVFCYGDGSCIVKFPDGDKYKVYNREEEDTILEISSLIKDYFNKEQVKTESKGVSIMRKFRRHSL